MPHHRVAIERYIYVLCFTEPPPPSYDDVLNAGSSIIVSPTANPPTPPTPTLPPPIAQSTPSSGEPSQSQRRMSGGRPQRMPGTQPSSASMLSSGRRPSTSQQRSTRQAAKPQPRGVFDRFATFSMPNVMMAGMSPPKIDAELDIEAHLPAARREWLRRQSQRHMRLKCCCGFMWCKLSLSITLTHSLTLSQSNILYL